MFVWGHKVAYIVSSLVLMGVAVRFYGLEAMGVWILGTTMATYVALLDFGASSSLPRTLPRLLSEGRQVEVAQLVSCAVLLGAGVGLLGILVTLAGGMPVVRLLLGDGAVEGVADGQYDILAVLVLAAFIGLPLRVGYGLLATVNRFDVYFGVDLLGVVLRLALVLLVVLEWRLGLFVFALVSVLPPLLANIAQFQLGMRRLRVRITFKGLSKSSVSELLSHTGSSLLLTFSAMLLVQGSTLAAAPLGTTAVAALAIPLMLVTQAASFSGSMGALVTPVASSLSVDKEAHLRDVAVGAISMSAAVSVPTVLVIFFAGPAFVHWWLGAGKGDPSSLMELVRNLQLLAFAAFFIGPASAVRGVLLGTGKHWSSGFTEFGGAVVGLGVGFVILQSTDWGVSALAAGVFVGFVVRFVASAVLLKARIRVRSFALAMSIIKPLGLLLLGVSAPVAIFGFPDAHTGYLALTAQVALGGAVWAWGTWLFVLTPSARNQLLKKIRRVFTRES